MPLGALRLLRSVYACTPAYVGSSLLWVLLGSAWLDRVGWDERLRVGLPPVLRLLALSPLSSSFLAFRGRCSSVTGLPLLQLADLTDAVPPPRLPLVLPMSFGCLFMLFSLFVVRPTSFLLARPCTRVGSG
ncbi:unnamed protein product, partial [Phaeothamnion confervicola]